MSDSDQSRPGRRRGGALGPLLAAIALFIVGAAIVVAPMAYLRLTAAGGSANSPVGPIVTAKPSVSPTPTTPSAPPVHKLDSALHARVLVGSRSLGASLGNGVRAAYSAAKQPVPKVAAWTDVMHKSGPVFATSNIGHNGDIRSKLQAFAELVNSAPRNSIDVAVMLLNYRDITADTDVDAQFQSYVDTMNSLEAANPDVRFLYATAPVTCENSWREIKASQVNGLTNVAQPVWQDNIARERFNTLVRNQYGQSGRLFDLAAIQASLGKDLVAAKQHAGLWYYVMNPALSPDGKRLNDKGGKEVANQLMMVAANAAAS